MKKVMNKSVFRLVVALAIGLFTALPAFARERQGGIVRISTKDGKTITGELIAVKKNSLILVENSSTEAMSIFFEDIKDLYILKRGRIADSTGLGLFIGTALGSIIGASTASSTGFFGSLFSRKGIALLKGGGIGLVAGTITGILIGKSLPTHVQLMEGGYSILPEAKFYKKLRSIAALPDAY